MKRLFIILFAYVALALFPVNLNAGGTIHVKETFRHDLEVMLFPGEHRFSAKDTITVPDIGPREFHFLLHRGLKPTSPTPGVIISRETDDQGKNLFESYRAMLPAGQHTFTLEYHGIIYHPIEDLRERAGEGLQSDSGYNLRRWGISCRQFLLVPGLRWGADDI